MKRLFAIALALIAMTACTEKRTNPFLTEWDTPFGIPPFEQIQNADYIPALQEGIRQHNAEIQAIIDNPEAPTFDNVIAAFDLSGGLLAKVSGVLFNLSETDNSPELEKVVEEATTLAAQHDNEITFNKDLFAKVEAINKQKEALGLTREQEMVLDKVYRSFADNGIALDEAGQARMKEINTELSTLSNRFGNYLLKENNAFKAQFGISISEYPDVMAVEEDRAKREAMFKAYSNRGNNGNENDTKEIILNILKLKEEKAKLLGYENRELAHEDFVDDAVISEPYGSGGHGVALYELEMGEAAQAGLKYQTAVRREDPAVGLVLLCREGPQGQICARRGDHQAVFQDGERPRRGVQHRFETLRAQVREN